MIWNLLMEVLHRVRRFLEINGDWIKVYVDSIALNSAFSSFVFLVSGCSILRWCMFRRRYSTRSYGCLSTSHRYFRCLWHMFTSGKSNHWFLKDKKNTRIVQVNGQQYYNACLIDYCLTSTNHPKQIQEALCNSFSALGRDCTDNYIDVSWRTTSRCRTYRPLDRLIYVVVFFSSEILSK